MHNIFLSFFCWLFEQFFDSKKNGLTSLDAIFQRAMNHRTLIQNMIRNMICNMNHTSMNHTSISYILYILLNAMCGRQQLAIFMTIVSISFYSSLNLVCLFASFVRPLCSNRLEHCSIEQCSFKSTQFSLKVQPFFQHNSTDLIKFAPISCPILVRTTSVPTNRLVSIKLI